MFQRDPFVLEHGVLGRDEVQISTLASGLHILHQPVECFAFDVEIWFKELPRRVSDVVVWAHDFLHSSIVDG